MLTAMFIDSHRPDRRYMTRQDFADYFVSVESVLYRGIVTDLRKQGIAKAQSDGATYRVRLHTEGHKAALARILKALSADTFSVDWQTKRILHDAQGGEIDSLIPTPDGWMLLTAEPKGKKAGSAPIAKMASTGQVAAKVGEAPASGGGSVGWINKYVTVWQSRIALGLAFFAALAVGLWPDHARNIDPMRLSACILTGFAWLAAELASAVTKVSNHDIALFERIRNIINDEALTFLREHDFAHYTHVRSTEPMNQIAEWHGPNFMFNDRAIQRRWNTLFYKIVALSHRYGDSLITTDKEHLLTAWHVGFERHNQPQRAHDEVNGLNEAAHDLYREYGEFVLFVRKRLDL